MTIVDKVVRVLTVTPDILRKWRVIKVSITLYLSWLLWVAMEWVMEDPYKELDGTVQSLVVSALILGLITGLFKLLDKIDTPIEKDKSGEVDK